MRDREQSILLYRHFCQALLLLSSLTLSGENFQCGWTLAKKEERMPQWWLRVTEGGFNGENISRTLEHLSYICAFWSHTSMFFSHTFSLIATIKKSRQSCNPQDLLPT